MRAALLIIGLFFSFQDDPFKTLTDPARRANEAGRKAALDAFRGRASESAAHWAAARFLEKKDPACPELDAYLARHLTGASLDEKGHRAGLDDLIKALDKNAAKAEAAEAIKLFALVHVSALGDKAADVMTKLGLTKEADRWGRKDLLAIHAVTKNLGRPGYLSADAERSARSSPYFGGRYAMMLQDLYKTFHSNHGNETTYKMLQTMAAAPGTSPKTADHLKALADGFKAAVYCTACKDGKLTCEPCLGKKRRDVTCPTCHGIGWAQKGGANANTLIKCIRCQGGGVFRNAACPDCAQTGIVSCSVCDGKAWRDGNKCCKDCKACGTCKGKKQTETPCATCGGKGRVAPFVAGIPTTQCTACLGNAIIKALCKDCSQSGLADCSTCGGKGVRDGKSPARPKVDDVYTGESCGHCGGKGWPLPNVAVPCDKCYGLSFIVRPRVAPTKVVD